MANLLMNEIQGFKKFMSQKSSFIDVSIAMFIANSFTNIVNSFSTNIVSPIVEQFTQKGLETYKYERPVTKNGQVNILSVPYGKFIQSLINFFIHGLVVYVMIRIYHKMTKLIGNSIG